MKWSWYYTIQIGLFYIIGTVQFLSAIHGAIRNDAFYTLITAFFAGAFFAAAIAFGFAWRHKEKGCRT